MKVLRILVVGSAVAFLSACGTTPEPIVIEQYKVMPTHYLASCDTVEPPESVAYKAATYQERIKMWTTVYVKQVGINEICNFRLQQAREYNLKFAGENK